MAISYKKLWKLLIDRDMKKKDLMALAGVMLFSRGHNMICCLAVAPEYHRRFCCR